ncbi:MAG: hypothetical protein ACSHW7_03185 [Patiriisocius sp.]|uniref:hypothetical protein n=1 Tax=Patiriisocius sp. TaxID=2822396 RepID=UPI003EF3A345
MSTESTAILVTLLIFIITTIFNYRNLIDDRNKRLYQEVIVTSHIIEIKNFFDLIISDFWIEKNNLNNNYSNSSSNNYLVDKALSLKKLNSTKNNFNYEIIPLFDSFDPKVSQRLTNILYKFQDTYTRRIGIENKASIHSEIQEELKLIKIDFFKELYMPIKQTYLSNIRLDSVILYILLIIFIILFSLK